MKKILNKGWAIWKGFSRKRQIIILSVKAAVLIGVVLLLILAPGKRTSRIEFLPYTSNQGGFTVDAPDGTMQFSKIPYTIAEMKVTLFIHTAEVEAGIFDVSHFDLPSGLVSPEEKTRLFNTLATEMLIQINGIIESSEAITLQGYSGLRVRASGVLGEKKRIAGMMILMVSNRIYIITASGEEGKLRMKYVDKFLSSFRFDF